LGAKLAIKELDLVDRALEVLEHLRRADSAHAKSQTAAIDDASGA
jgi:hypothetical protein